MTRQLRDVIELSNPNNLPAALRALKFGQLLSCVPRFGRFAVSSNKIVLPERAKAAMVLNCYVRAGTVNGQFTGVQDSTPATTQISPNASGDLVFLNTDAVTDAEVLYVPVEGALYEEEIIVTSNVGTLGASRSGKLLLEVTALTGGSVGAKTPVDRATTPTAGNAALNLLGTGVVFAGADAITRARVKYIATPGVGTEPLSNAQLLEASQGW